MKLFLSTIFFLVLNHSFSQVEFEALKAYPKETLAEYKGVLPLGEKRAVMFGRSELTKSGNDHYEFIFYDTQLQTEKQTSIPIDKKFRLRSTCTSGDDVYVLFTNKEEYSFLHITPSFSITKIDGTFPDKIDTESCYVMNSTAYFTGKNALVMLDLNTEQSSIKYYEAELFDAQSLLLTKFQTFPERDECMAFFVASPGTMSNFAVRLNSAGEVLSIFNLTEALGYTAATMSATIDGEKEYSYGGAYAQYGNSLPEGLFFISVKDEKVASVKTYNFLDLEAINRNFYKIGHYNGSKVEKQYNKQIEAKESQKIYAFPMRSATHDLVKIDNTYLLVNEVFEDKYFYNARNNGYRKAGLVQFATLAILLDEAGELIWNKNFNVPGDYFSPNEKLLAKINISNDEVHFGKTHSEGISFATLSLKDGEIIGKTKDEKPLESETLEHFSTQYILGYPGDIAYWYDNSWLAYGLERLKEKDRRLTGWENYIIHKVNYVPEN